MSAAADKHESDRQDGREVEWQLDCPDLKSVRRWLTDHGTIDGLVLEPRSTQQIFDTYLDTDDWRIHRAGFALRIRSGAGKSEATLKSLESASADFADRRELNETLENGESGSIRHLPGPVGIRVQAVSGAHELLPLFEVRTMRQRFAVRREDESRQLGEIALDDTVISRPHGEPRTSLQRVEVEALTEAHEPLHSLVKTLRNDCALEAASDSKYAQGLRSVGLAPVAAPQFAPIVVDRSMTVQEIALANLRRYLSAWFLHEPGARLGDDPEELHDLRVAGRRMDAVLRQFAAALPAPLPQIRPVLKEVLRVLGEARDLDVALLELAAFSRDLPETDRAAAEPLFRHLAAERAHARTRMLSVLDSVRVQEALRELTVSLTVPAVPPAPTTTAGTTATAAPPAPTTTAAPTGSTATAAPTATSAPTAPTATAEPTAMAAPTATAARDAAASPAAEPAVRAAPAWLRRRYRKMSKLADRLKPGSSAEAYHEVRGRVKKLRYALEAVAELFGKPAAQMLRALRRWQEKLGQQQDAAVASRRLKTLADSPAAELPPATLFLMGRLAEHHAVAAARARKRYAKGRRRVRGKWKKLSMKFAAPAAQARRQPDAAD